MPAAIPDIPTSTNLTGYSILITGATAGIGFENARQYLQLGASPLYLPVRNLERGEKAKKELLGDPIVKRNNPDAVIHLYEMDLTSFDTIKAFATKLTEEVKQLNILVHNAGISFFKYVSTTDNNEILFQVNYLSNVLLASYLIPLLKASAASSGKASHLTLVSSEMHKLGGFGTKKIIADDASIVAWFNDKQNMAMDRYNISKILVNAYANELATRVSAEEIIVNSMCPGLVATNFDVNSPFWLRSIMKVVRGVSARDPASGGRTVTLATLTGPDGHGKYFSDAKVIAQNPWLTSDDGEKFQKRLWTETQQYLLQFDSTIPTL